MGNLQFDIFDFLVTKLLAEPGIALCVVAFFAAACAIFYVKSLDSREELAKLRNENRKLCTENARFKRREQNNLRAANDQRVGAQNNSCPQCKNSHSQFEDLCSKLENDVIILR